MLPVMVIYSQESEYILSVDSLKNYLSGNWKVREWRCWDKQYKDTIIREVFIKNGIFQYNESYHGKIQKCQTGQIKIDSMNQWYKISIILDDKSKTNNINTLLLNTKLHDINIFESNWLEAFYKNSEQKSIHHIGSFIFTRKLYNE